MFFKMKRYNVNFIQNENLVITGIGTSSLWEKSEVLTDFMSTWNDEKKEKIEFRSLWGNEKIFFLFKVFDISVHIDKTDDTVESIGKSDRVELFFRINEKLSPYYCLEIDPTSRIMDFKALPNKQFDFDWNWPKEDILVKSFIGEEFFCVELEISLESLKRFKLLKDNKLETGIFRAKYNQQEDKSYEPTWITWVNPNTETPNFHTPTSFGELNLKNNLK